MDSKRKRYAFCACKVINIGFRFSFVFCLISRLIFLIIEKIGEGCSIFVGFGVFSRIIEVTWRIFWVGYLIKIVDLRVISMKWLSL